jgi:hypothetical protein
VFPTLRIVFFIKKIGDVFQARVAIYFFAELAIRFYAGISNNTIRKNTKPGGCKSGIVVTVQNIVVA